MNMKTPRTILIALALFAATAFLTASDPSETTFINLPLNATAIAATTSNNTAGTAMLLTSGPSQITIFATATGVGASTNGTLTFKFSIASGVGTTTNDFSDADSSAINIVIPAGSLGGATFTGTDWFVTPGVRYIRCGRVENNTMGAVSNMTVRIGITR